MQRRRPDADGEHAHEQGDRHVLRVERTGERGIRSGVARPRTLSAEREEFAAVRRLEAGRGRRRKEIDGSRHRPAPGELRGSDRRAGGVAPGARAAPRRRERRACLCHAHSKPADRHQRHRQPQGRRRCGPGPCRNEVVAELVLKEQQDAVDAEYGERRRPALQHQHQTAEDGREQHRQQRQRPDHQHRDDAEHRAARDGKRRPNRLFLVLILGLVRRLDLRPDARLLLLVGVGRLRLAGQGVHDDLFQSRAWSP